MLRIYAYVKLKVPTLTLKNYYHCYKGKVREERKIDTALP